MTSVSSALARASATLAATGVDTPRLDARLLLEWASGLNTAALISRSESPLAEEQIALFERAIAKRSEGCPVARIVGEKEFWGLAISLCKDTLVPRPDTETLVEAVLARIDRPRQAWTGRVCDLGTGSGAILIALLSELPRANGVGVDLSAAAIETARRNSERHGLAERITWLVGDYCELPHDRFDVVVCNPPYIAEPDLTALAPEVREYDPFLALCGGQDGLDAYRALAVRLPQLLDNGGLAALELGFGQAEKVTALTIENGLDPVGVEADIAGIPRVLLAQMPLTVAPLQQLPC